MVGMRSPLSGIPTPSSGQQLPTTVLMAAVGVRGWIEGWLPAGAYRSVAPPNGELERVGGISLARAHACTAEGGDHVCRRGGALKVGGWLGSAPAAGVLEAEATRLSTLGGSRCRRRTSENLAESGQLLQLSHYLSKLALGLALINWQTFETYSLSSTTEAYHRVWLAADFMRTTRKDYELASFRESRPFVHLFFKVRSSYSSSLGT